MIEWSGELTSFEYMMFRADVDSHSRTSIVQIETLDTVPEWDRLRYELDRASRVALRLRQHVVAPLLPLTPARWVVDPDFDLDYHLRRISLPAPGDFRQLLDLAQVLHAAPLDLGRPLWELTLVEGLNDGDGKAALIWKMSHAITDGVGGMLLDSVIRTGEREPERGPLPQVPVPEDVSPIDMTRRAVRRLPITLVGGAVKLVGRARDPGATLRSAAHVLGSLRKMAAPVAPPSPLLRRRSLNRRFDAFDVPLSALRDAAKAHGFSVNDAYIAAVGGAMRHYHEQLGVPVDVIALGMPISIRAADGLNAGNQWTAATIAAPVAEADPVKRMRAVRELVLHARAESTSNPMGLIAPVLAWMPQQLMSGLGGGSVGLDIQASNVPGAPAPRYLAGAKVLRNVPIGPLPGVAMMLTMMSQAGRCYVGAHYDTAAFTDSELLEVSLRRGFDEVIAVGTAKKPPPTKKASQRRNQ